MDTKSLFRDKGLSDRTVKALLDCGIRRTRALAVYDARSARGNPRRWKDFARRNYAISSAIYYYRWRNVELANHSNVPIDIRWGCSPASSLGRCGRPVSLPSLSAVLHLIGFRRGRREAVFLFVRGLNRFERYRRMT